MTGHKIRVTGVKLKKDGTLETVDTQKLSVSQRIARKKSKRIRVKKGIQNDATR